ncbi:hypothetical protein CN212_21010 [Sinorhizobium meliloti]|nr:hypothetical protein CN238_29135 [Sinorhizobium meliloti]RVE84630.1 hypothetical protein CN235_30995 [Sinorhizobium meliloti]RVG60724.1 hypothetical protein CN220_31675 [Sinorhizobium meliloti]RVH07131.1 hypothetical protein CN216_30500 [Sinorhizobium meliloti]RVH21722.1 hypothetical protein CN214_31205 [Sinorhizobium meliloti]
MPRCCGIRVTPTPPPFLAKNFGSHPIPRLKHVGNGVVNDGHQCAIRQAVPIGRLA